MKIVYNACFGGFGINPEFFDIYGIDEMYGISIRDLVELERSKKVRTDPRLVEYVETHPKECEDDCSRLKIVDIPDNATDWMVTEYDGAETVYYVVDGKIRCCEKYRYTLKD